MSRPIPPRVLLPVVALLVLPSLLLLGIVAWFLCFPGPGPDYGAVFPGGQVVTGATGPEPGQ